jgi:uncharacterized phage-associated protein
MSPELKNISDAIIVLHRNIFGESPSPMKLQKLCYYSQGYYLAENQIPLFGEDFQAWQHGPVVFELYTQYKHFQWRSISDDKELPELDSELHTFLENIVYAYGRYDGAALSTMTHRESPWIEAREDLDEYAGSNNVIEKSTMKKYFFSKLKDVNV